MTSNAEAEEQLKRDIVKCLQEQSGTLNDLRARIKGKDVVILVGNTRSGKSTLVNYIIGNELEGWESGKKIFKIRLKEECNGPDIGHGSLSCTATPEVYNVRDQPNSVIVDPPGFEDNRGIIQDIINALYVSQIKCARTVKFVLVFDINEITNDNISQLSNGLGQVQLLVTNFDKLKRSFAILFTKDDKDYNQEEIVDLFHTKILNQDRLCIDKALVQHFAENKKLIGIFKMPSRVGDVTNELDLNIQGAIKECHAVEVDKCDIKFALSDNARVILREMYPEYTDTNYFEHEVARITEMYNCYFDIDKYVYASYDEELTATEAALEEIYVNVSNAQTEERSEMIQIQNSLFDLLRRPVSGEFTRNFNFVIVLDKSSLFEDEYKQIIFSNYVNSLEKLERKITNLRNKIASELDERRRNRIVFGVAGITAAAGILPALTGVAKVVGTVVRTGPVATVASPGVAAFGAAEVAVGGAVAMGTCIAGAGLVGVGAGVAYVKYKEHYGKRKAARREQGRET